MGDPIWICFYSVLVDPRRLLGPVSWVVAVDDDCVVYSDRWEAYRRFLHLSRLAGRAS